MRFDPSELAKAHCAPASHRISPVGHECLLAEHLVVDARWLAGGPLQSRQEFHRGVQGTLGRAEVWRLADRVVEPSDHEHPD
jgi:hypothetical protein